MFSFDVTWLALVQRHSWNTQGAKCRLKSGTYMYVGYNIESLTFCLYTYS